MGTKAVIVGGHRSGKTALMQQMVAEAEARGEHVVTLTKEPIIDEAADIPPSHLSIDPNSPDFHPSYVRVGVRVDGKERNDLQWYDVKRLEYMTTDKTSHLAESIEPYWRFAESRQQRRARERWEGKRK
jgi:hypothetical protein